MPRIRLWHTFALISLIAMGLATLRYPYDWTARICVTTTIGSLLLCALCAIYLRHRRRRFFVGATLFATTFFFLTYIFNGNAAGYLATSELNMLLFDAMHSTERFRSLPVELEPFGVYAHGDNFDHIANSFWTILIGGFGGVASLCVGDIGDRSATR